MKKVIIYHNPRCSKSRETLNLLESNGITLETTLQIRDYLKNPPDIQELKTLLGQLDMQSARQLMRTKENLYAELGLADENNEQNLLQALANNPNLIERPIVIVDNKAKIGRPPENVLELFY